MSHECHQNAVSAKKTLSISVYCYIWTPWTVRTIIIALLSQKRSWMSILRHSTKWSAAKVVIISISVLVKLSFSARMFLKIGRNPHSIWQHKYQRNFLGLWLHCGIVIYQQQKCMNSLNNLLVAESIHV